MLDAPGRWLRLFLASAVFWWGFEWMNRFVRNWHYLGVEDFGPVAYAVHATLCFSTVLPAVAAASEWLAVQPGFQQRCATGPKWAWLTSPPTAFVLVAGACAALLLTGARPQWFYPALWAAPIALWVGSRSLAGSHGWWSGVSRGDWREAATWSVAALICGVFWEMWNLHSAAKWIYTVPYVDRWQVFEMPVLGYLGYLGFGLECCAVANAVGARLGAPLYPLNAAPHSTR